MYKIIKLKPQNIVDLQEFIPNIYIGLDYATKDNFTGNIVPGYNKKKALLLKPVAEVLKKIQLQLNKQNLSIYVFDAYRPYTSVQYFFELDLYCSYFH